MDWFSAEVVGNDLIGEKFRWLTIRPGREVGYQAGQYFILKISEAKQNSYSIFSLPGSENIEAIVDVSPGKLTPPSGEGSRYVDGLKIGDKVEIAAPFGRFVLKEDGTATKIFIATGCGIASIFPMVFTASEDRAVSTVLFWGLRYPGNLILQEQLAELTESRLNFVSNIVLSQPSGEWGGMTGHVTEKVQEWLTGFLGGGGTGREVSFYVCGNGQMIKDVAEMLGRMGILKEKIYWEKYYENEIEDEK